MTNVVDLASVRGERARKDQPAPSPLSEALSALETALGNLKAAAEKLAAANQRLAKARADDLTAFAKQGAPPEAPT